MLRHIRPGMKILITINKDEVADWKWMALEDVKNDLNEHPEHYTIWFSIIFDKFYEHINISK